MSTRVAVIIPAAGEGRRMGSPKAFLELAGRPVLAYTLAPFLRHDAVLRIVIALDGATVERPPAWLCDRDPRIVLVTGGADRTGSVRQALEAVPETVDVILVHDAARPFVSDAVIERAIRAAADGLAVTAAIPLEDTIHETDAQGRIIATPARERLWRAQTPQAFPAALLRAAHRSAAAAGESATDDAELVARLGSAVHVIEGAAENFKLTVPRDLAVAEARLRER